MPPLHELSQFEVVLERDGMPGQAPGNVFGFTLSPACAVGSTHHWPWPVVSAVSACSSAGGLRLGDLIKGAAGHDTQGVPLKSVAEIIAGCSSRVSLSVLRVCGTVHMHAAPVHTECRDLGAGRAALGDRPWAAGGCGEGPHAEASGDRFAPPQELGTERSTMQSPVVQAVGRGEVFVRFTCDTRVPGTRCTCVRVPAASRQDARPHW